LVLLELLDKAFLAVMAFCLAVPLVKPLAVAVVLVRLAQTP
jgi:hypothetical protein